MSARPMPRHVAIIMDGNGRWAQQRGLERIEGHRQGAEVVRTITTHCRSLNIPYLTLFSFSAQNWRRPVEEIEALMELLTDFCAKERPTLLENDIRLDVVGRLDRLPVQTRQALESVMVATAHCQTMTLSLAVDYGGREEIVAAAAKLAQRVQQGELKPEDIDEEALCGSLLKPEHPDPDLLIRTSGEVRVSNFMLWQLAYAEFFFSQVPWPDFTTDDFDRALAHFTHRERRFGGLAETGGIAC